MEAKNQENMDVKEESETKRIRIKKRTWKIIQHDLIDTDMDISDYIEQLVHNKDHLILRAREN